MADSRITALAARAEPFAYAALRIASGLMFTFHGAQKIFGWHAPAAARPGSQVFVGGLIELVCGPLIALGLFTRAAAFLASGMMAVAYFQFHWKLATADGMWIPAVNKGELAVLYCFALLFIAARGGGWLSLDGRARGSR